MKDPVVRLSYIRIPRKDGYLAAPYAVPLYLPVTPHPVAEVPSPMRDICVVCGLVVVVVEDLSCCS